MQQYEYLVVPFWGYTKGQILDAKTAQRLSSQLQALINEYAQQGWEFYRIDKVEIQLRPGCLGFALQAKPGILDQVIFRRPAG